MKNKIILTILIIIFYIHFTNGKGLSYDDIPNYLTKDEVLKLKNAYFVAFYCKDNLCAKTNYEYTDSFVEFPDENGKMKKYITDTCPRNKFKYGMCNGKNQFYTNCTTNSDCLSNKCLKNVCVFNDENPIVHCDDIYLGGKKSYMHCGKPYYDTCKTDDECSSEICVDVCSSKICDDEEKVCNMQYKSPSDSEGAMGIIYSFYVMIIALFLLICCCCYSNCKKKKKKK